MRWVTLSDALSIFQVRACRNRGEKGAEGLHPPQIFAKVDLLIIDIYREKEKIANKKKKQTRSNSSKTTGNITFVHFWNHEIMELVLWWNAEA